MIRYPKLLTNNDTIGITAPSERVNEKKFPLSKANIEKLGFTVVTTTNIFTQNKLVSSTPKTRVDEFVKLWKSEDVKLIISARGGEFLMETLPYFEKEKEVFENLGCKWFQGYSDNSLLNVYLTTKYNIATVHFQNIGDYAMNPLHNSLIANFEILKGRKTLQSSFENYQLVEIGEKIDEPYNLTEKVKYKILGSSRNIKFEGRILGGCIDVLNLLHGTKYDNVQKFCSQFNEGIIWYIDNCELNAAQLYRNLWQARQCGWFDNVKGFLIGRTFKDQDYFDFTYLDAIEKSIGDIGVDIIYDVDIGHVPPQLTLINGSYGKFIYNVEDNKGTLEQMFI